MSTDRAIAARAAGGLALGRVDGWQLLRLLGVAVLPPLLLALPLPALVRVPLGLAAVLFGPGYALLAALFHRREFDLPARLGLSFGLSVAVLPLLALLLDTLPWGLRPWPMAASLSAWVGACALATVLRGALSPPGAEDAEPEPHVRLRDRWDGLGTRGQLAYVLGGALVAMTLVVGARAMTAPDPSAQLTEFFALGDEGLAEGYPREVAPGETMQVQLGITNREGVAARYSVTASSGGAALAQLGPVDVADGATWTAPLRYALPSAGDDQQVEIALFRDGQATPYRTLRLWVNVRGATP